MKKNVILFVALLCLIIFTGCKSRKPDYTEIIEVRTEHTATSTGYPSEEIQQPQIMYDGLLYYYFATGFDELLPDGYECVGEIESVDNENTPEFDFCGARVNLGQEIYVLPGIHGTIYVKYDNGYARFSIRKEDRTESALVIAPTCNFVEAAIADDFIDPATVSVLSGKWAYTVDPERFLALVSVRYINKFGEYETAEYVVLGTFEGDAQTRHCLNQYSPYTRDNVLESFGAVNDQRFTLE